MDPRKRLQQTRHAVVKIGSAVFFKDGVHVDRLAFVGLIAGLDDLIRRGWLVTVVSSGAVAMGRQGVDEAVEESRDIPRLQALAAMGQSRLMQMYETEFSHYGHRVAQILFSRDDLSDRGRYLNARRTLQQLVQLGAVPVINENDTVATEELRFGDNDELAAMTAGLVGAQTLILLSDVNGLQRAHITEDGQRRLGETVHKIDVDDPRIDEWAGPSQNGVGKGGMISKVSAARIAARSGAQTVIARGKQPGILTDIAEGKRVGTVFEPGEERIVTGRKVWLGSGARAEGTIVCDAGACAAIRERGASLLPSGIIDVRGDFEEGEVVTITDEEGNIFARGLSVYAAADLAQIAGEHSSAIEAVLGYKLLDEAVHRDNLIVL